VSAGSVASHRNDFNMWRRSYQLQCLPDVQVFQSVLVGELLFAEMFVDSRCRAIWNGNAQVPVCHIIGLYATLFVQSQLWHCPVEGEL
jgi:hypothetical protein